MGILDNLKAKLGPAKDKVSDLAKEHGDKIDQGLDKVAKTVDERTKGKYSDKIQTGTGKAKEALDRVAGKDDGPGTSGADGTGSPPSSPDAGGPSSPPSN